MNSKAERTTSRINPKKYMTRHTVIKPLKIKDIEKSLKKAQWI
jgi:hypothetical protein